MSRMQHKNQTQGDKTSRFIETKLAISDAGTMEFSGYAAVFGNVDSHGDIIEKGAFATCLSDIKSGVKNWPAMLMQHGGWGIGSDDMTPIGIWTDLTEDDTGLKVTGKLADTPRGQESYQLLKMTPRPAISGLSIGYFAKEYTYGSQQDAYDRLLKQVDLMEISLVTFPSNDKSRINSVKSAKDLTEREFERLMQDAGLTRKEARIVMNHGFRHFKAMQDAGSEELNQLAASLDRTIKIFSTNPGA